MRMAIALGGLVLVLFGSPAGADILKLKGGEELRGTVQIITFATNDAKSLYPRDEVTRVSLGTDGKDALETKTPEKLVGRLDSVTFEAEAGMRAVPRDKLEALTLDNATTLAAIRSQQRVEAEKKEEEDKGALSEDQKQALTTNRQLLKSYTDAADSIKDEGMDAVRKRFMDRVRSVVNDIQRLERSIVTKLQRREDASTSTYRRSDGGTQMSERERLIRTDGLARDQEDLERAKATARKLKATIRDEEEKVREKTRERVSRIETVYARNRKEILDGQVLTEEAMVERYENAIRLPGEKPFKVTTPAQTGPRKPATPNPPAQPKSAPLKGLSDLKGQ